MKKIIIPLLIIILIAVSCVVAFLNHKQNTYADMEQDLTNQDFSENVYHKNNTYISGSRILASTGRYIYYWDMQSGVGNPLCSVPDCPHNNTDECMALFADAYLQEFVYVYNQKLIVGGASNDGFAFFSADMDGSNHEKIASANFRSDMAYQGAGTSASERTQSYDFSVFQTSDLSDFIVKDDKVYICVTLEDTVNTEQTESGFMTNGPCIVMVYCLDLQTNKLQKIYEFEDNLYCEKMDFRYFQGNQLYFDFSGLKAQYEEIYDLQTDQLKSPEMQSQLVRKVGCFDLDTKTVTWLDAYTYKDYIGTRNQERFFLEREEDSVDTASGEIRVEDFEGNIKDTITLSDVKGMSIDYDSRVLAVEDGFFVDLWNDTNMEYYGNVAFYDTAGNRKEFVEKSNYAIIGEQDNYYLLSESAWGYGPTHYLGKEDFSRINKKAVELAE